MRTTPVKAIVHQVLTSLAPPYSEHVIDDVFAAIEKNPTWLKRYREICEELTKTVVNNWVGYWTATALGKVGTRDAPAKKSSLIGSYSILDTDAKTLVSKPKEDEARQLMADYYQTHKAELPPEVRKHREVIVELIMNGLSAAEAFSKVLGPAV